MPRTFNACNNELLRALSRKERIQIMLTGADAAENGTTLIPDYKTLRFTTNDVVMFVEKGCPGSVFMGRVSKIGTISRTNGRNYEVRCIPRPKIRDSQNIINWLQVSTVTRSQILCRLVEGPKLNPEGKK